MDFWTATFGLWRKQKGLWTMDFRLYENKQRTVDFGLLARRAKRTGLWFLDFLKIFKKD